MDASDLQIGAVIIQEVKSIAFYRRKLTGPQKWYTVTEKECLSMVEALKEFHMILLSQQLKIYADHKNITCKKFNINRVLRWRLILEEYGLGIEYIPGNKNTDANTLSQLLNNENQ